MSRIGTPPISIPDKTEVAVDGSFVVVKGPLGELRRRLHKDVNVEIEDKKVQIVPVLKTPRVAALWGTYASHVRNMIQGVNKAHEKKLIVEGVGYRANVEGDNLKLLVGFSHPVELEIPKDVEVSVEKNTIIIKGVDKETVGQFASEVRAVRKPEPYKGKGIRYADEVVRRKQGKKAA